MAFMAAALPSILGSVAAGIAVSALTKKSTPSAAAAEAPAPQVEAPTPMPTPNDAERKAAQRRSIADQMARRGRASTILTNDADAKLGG